MVHGVLVRLGTSSIEIRAVSADLSQHKRTKRAVKNLLPLSRSDVDWVRGNSTIKPFLAVPVWKDFSVISGS